MSQDRAELARLVAELPDEEVPIVLAAVLRLLQPAADPESTWPPPWFGSIRSGRSDAATNVDEILAEGFGQP